MFKPGKTLLDKTQIKKDKILKEGLEIRQKSHVFFYICAVATLFTLTDGNWIWDILMAIIIIGAWNYSRKFRKWELTNKEYITNLGFDVK